jgi:hypothetical protein
MELIRVYDDRTNETLFESEDGFDCVDFIHKNYDENHEDWGHIWIQSSE